MDDVYGYPNRTLCDVIKEAHKCCETLNFSYLPGLLHEIQHYANKMEAGLGDKHDVKRFEKLKSDLIKEVRELREAKTSLGGEGKDV